MRTLPRNKLKWGRKLKPGDVVCDCRFRHIKIKNIKPEHMDISNWITLVPLWVPDKVYDVFVRVAMLTARVFGGKLVDFEVELEDGTFCSLIHCCDDPNDHTEADHPELQQMVLIPKERLIDGSLNIQERN